MAQQSDARPAGSRPGARLLTKLLISALSVIVMLGLLEGIGYLWERREAEGIYAWELVASRRMEFIAVPTPNPEYTLFEPGKHYEWRGIPVEINSLGLRNPETSYEKPAGVFRILNVGDSIAMGWAVRYEDTYGFQLQTMLNGFSIDGLQIEVINAGVPGWSGQGEASAAEG